MIIEHVNTHAQCRYCQTPLILGETQEGMLPMCEPSAKIGLICRWCGSVSYGPAKDEVSFEAST